MNPYIKNLNRLEFLITLACTGKCKHCSEGEHKAAGPHLEGKIAAEVVYKVAHKYKIDSLMTFGGEPLLYVDPVCEIHKAAKEAGIPKRQLITNGFFSREEKKIRQVAAKLAKSGVNAILLSVDAFHQETIPLEVVQLFAEAVKEEGIWVRTHPAWLSGRESENPYDKKTSQILDEFACMGIMPSEGNLIFPEGNALKYLKEYFDPEDPRMSPYTEDERDIRAICIGPDGNVLGGNIYGADIMELIDGYMPPGGR